MIRDLDGKRYIPTLDDIRRAVAKMPLPGPGDRRRVLVNPDDDGSVREIGQPIENAMPRGVEFMATGMRVAEDRNERTVWLLSGIGDLVIDPIK